jgi:hypothetical protein
VKRLPEAVLLASMALFITVGTRLADELPSWHEIVSALPNNPTRVVPGKGRALALERSCLDEPRPRWVVSTSRPHLSLCVGAQALPVMVTPYASGMVTWPLALLHGVHGGDTFVMRRIWIVLAALSLLLTFALVRRVADRSTAALVCLLTAASSPFLFINALLLPFETLPCTLTVAALSCWATLADPDGPRSGRLYLGALLAGLAVATNVKALFLLLPVLAVARGEGVRLAAIGGRRAALMLGLFVLPLAPMLVFAAVDPLGGLMQQLGMRGGFVVENLRWSRLLSEPLRLFNFAADVGSYVGLAQGDRVRWGWPQLLVAPPLLWCMAVAVARLFGRRLGSRLAAACGAVIVTYFFVSMLLYRQNPGGNYSPLHEVFGIAMAAGAIDLGRLALGKRPRAALAAAAAGVGVLAAAALVVTLGGADFTRRVAFSINAAAERAAAHHLRTRPDAGTPLYSTTYNLAGVFDALGHGSVHAIQIHDYLGRCGGEREPVDVCLAARWKPLLAPGRLPVRVILPVGAAAVDKPVEVVQRLEPTLMASARELGLNAQLEATFSTAAELPVLALYRVAAP